jgi:predicted RNA-binding Zn-ribbon protein involved in translation (DUF1610 family)
MCTQDNCPLCGGTVIPKDGATVEETLVRGIITLYAEMQGSDQHTETPLPCPRCGYDTMSTRVQQNALSRHENIYICDACGLNEGARVFANKTLPTREWWIVSQFFSLWRN